MIGEGVGRVPVRRVLADGTEEAGSALLMSVGASFSITDFRDAKGAEWNLPAGARFEIEPGS